MTWVAPGHQLLQAHLDTKIRLVPSSQTDNVVQFPAWCIHPVVTASRQGSGPEKNSEPAQHPLIQPSSHATCTTSKYKTGRQSRYPLQTTSACLHVSPTKTRIIFIPSPPNPIPLPPDPIVRPFAASRNPSSPAPTTPPIGAVLTEPERPATTLSPSGPLGPACPNPSKP